MQGRPSVFFSLGGSFFEKVANRGIMEFLD